MLWDRPDDGMGFEEYLAAQNIPVIRIPFVKRTEEWVPEPEPNPAWDCEEDDATRLSRMLQCEEMRTEHLWRELDQMTRKRDFWQRGCAYAYGVALAALMALASVVWR